MTMNRDKRQAPKGREGLLSKAKRAVINSLRAPIRTLVHTEALNYHAVHFMTAEEQARYTPHMVLQDLMDGNERFSRGEHTVRDHSLAIRQSYSSQYPKAFVLSCIDSRVPVEDIFDQGIGDIFVGRVAGNYATNDMIASMEYACVVAGAKVILVLGHENCGAIRGAIEGVELGLLTGLLEQIRPAICSCGASEGRTASDYQYTHDVAVWNIRHSLQQIRRASPALRELEMQGQIIIKGAFYALSTGAIEFFDH